MKEEFWIKLGFIGMIIVWVLSALLSLLALSGIIYITYAISHYLLTH